MVIRWTRRLDIDIGEEEEGGGGDGGRERGGMQKVPKLFQTGGREEREGGRGRMEALFQ